MSSNVFKLLIDFIFPQECLGCGEGELPICGDCLTTCQPARLRCVKCDRDNPFGKICEICKTRYTPDLVRAVFTFEGVLREAIHHFKYEDATSFAQCLAEPLARLIESLVGGEKGFILVPIPLSAWRRRQRGYNQAELLAQAVGEKTAPGAGQEIQLVDAIRALVKEEKFYAYEFDGELLDAGEVEGYIKATIKLALERPELKENLVQYIKDLDKN